MCGFHEFFGIVLIFSIFLIQRKNFLFQHVENELPNTTYDPEFMADLMDNANLVRNVALVGHLHHGKSSFVDCLIHQTHPDLQTKEDKPLR